MLNAEPFLTAFLLTAVAVLIGISILSSRGAQRLGVPLALVFLGIGMLAGNDGLGIPFTDFRLAYRVGTVALVLILFDGGLNTSYAVVRPIIAPAAVLATLGVVGTAALTGVAAHLLGFTWPLALLIGAIVSSTDAAAVFSALRASSVELKRRLAALLEVESGANDPMAVILTTLITEWLLTRGGVSPASIPLAVLRQIVVGGVVGLALGRGTRWLLARYQLPASGLYAVLMLVVAMLAYGLATLADGSGYLAVYLAGLVLGNGPLPFRTSVLRLQDALAWLAQIGMFLVLGLLVNPSQLPSVATAGLTLALALAFVVRPVVVALCLAPFRVPLRDTIYTGWVGLRGAVPIILATFPVLSGAAGATRIFDLVFFVVVVNVLLQGMTLPWVTRRLELESAAAPRPPAVIEIESRQPLRGSLLTYYIDEDLAVAGSAIRDLPLPDGAVIALIVRGNTLVPPKGRTVLRPEDHVYVLVQPDARAMVELLFGRAAD